MSDPQPVHVGEVLRGLRAADHNAFYETWKKVNGLRPMADRLIPPSAQSRLVVTVFNTGAAIDADFPILKLTAPCFTTDDRESVLHEPIAFDGATPDDETDESNIAIVQGPIGASPAGRGHGVISGATWVKIYWTDADHTHAKVKSGDNTQLESSAGGIQVLWHEEIPDPEYLPASLWAVVMLRGSSTALRFAIVTTQADAASGTAGDNVTPGVGAATLYGYGAALGDAAIAGSAIDFENYMRAPVVVDKPILVYERAAGIWVAHAEGCEPYPEGT